MDTKKLRQKLLDLAIHGKLVPQDPNDEPASELLARIREEKLAMVERGELKPKDVKNDTVIYFGSDGLPYEKRADGKGESTPVERVIRELPSGWAWTRMSMVAKVEAGKTPSKDAFADEGIPYFKMYNLRNQAIDFDFQPQFIKPEVHYGQLGKSRIHPGDLIMNIVGPPLGKLAIVPDSFPEANTNQAAVVIHSLSSEVPITWLFYYLSEMSEINSVSTRGSAGQVNISVNQSREMFVAIPPLAEQRRIVDALDKYLALVDGIERDRADLDGLLARLKSKVLDLAVRGELLEHDPGDEPASELLARIREEKLAMVERGELKPKDVKGDTVIFAGSDGLRYEKRADGKGEAKCIEEEVPFDLPEGWSWARLGSICSLLRRGKSPVYTDDKVIPVFAQKCNQPWGITLEKVKFLDDSALGKYGEELKLRSGDVVVNSTGTGTLGRVGLFNESILGEYPFIVPDSHVAVVRTLGSVLGEYVFHLLRSEYGQRLIFSKQTGSTNQKELPAKEVAFFLIPVPPLAEQRRIVKRIEEVFNLLD